MHYPGLIGGANASEPGGITFSRRLSVHATSLVPGSDHQKAEILRGVRVYDAAAD